ncbi:MAG TPA: guanylate kinase [Burkholderiales bacterium]
MSGSLFIVAAPSGAGKSSLVNALLERDAGLNLSISYSTRAPRPGEVDGKNYHFVDRETFLAMEIRGEFLEFAEVHGNLYGTSKPWIEGQMRAGRDIVLEIDCQGAAQVKKIFSAAVAIFILPPSMAELERRLRGRGTDSEAVIAGRMHAAEEELSRAREFDYAIINSDFSEARDQLACVVAAARLRLAQVAEREARLFGDFGIRW